MHSSNRFGYVLYPLFFFILLAAPGLNAQNPTDAAPSAQPQTQQQPENPQPENPQEDQIRLARAAQARIHARRQQRVQQMIQQIYSHKFEVYGGGGYLRFHAGTNIQHNNETAWNAGFTDYIRPRLGITLDTHGDYGNAYIGNNSAPYEIFKPSISQYAFMAGPQYRITRGLHLGTSAQILVGVDKGNFYGNSAEFPGNLVGLWNTSTVLSVGAGIPLDYNVSPALAFRLTPNYLLTTFNSTAQLKNLGFTADIVYRFGHQSRK